MTRAAPSTTQTAALEIHLLGHPQFLADGKPIRLAKRSVSIPLAAYLLLHRDESISRNFLAFTLWANEAEDLALSELRRYVYLLNKALPPSVTGDPWIRADDDVLRWNFDNPMRLDVADFEQASLSPTTYSEAVKIYGGDLLEDTYDDWVLSYRERLRAMYFADLAGLIVQHREIRDFKRAAEFASQLLVADPWREDIVRLLMMCRYEAGDSAGALAAFDAFAKRLHTDLGVEPMPETLVAREAIVRNAPLPASLGTQRQNDIPQQQPRPREDVLPFTGRQLELDQLRASWVRAARGNGGLAFVSGQAGMGKSRLVAELATSVEAEGGRVCVGSTTYAERFPYEGIVEALRYCLPFVASLDLDPLRSSIIAQLLPELSAWRDGLPDIPPVDPRREQARLLDAVSTCIAAMARPRPMLIILEDLHWAGAATVAAIAFLARRLSRSAVLIVGTYREEEVGRAHPLRAIHQELRGEQLVQTLALRPLTQATIEQIVETLPIAQGERERIARIAYERSEGNPLFLTEALRDAMQSQTFQSDSWTGTDVLRTLIASRLDSLGEEAREIARLAAVAGHGFQVDLVRDVAGIDESKVLDGIYELMDRHLVREAGVRRRYDFAFTHHLIHNAVYESIDPTVRSRRHRRIAQILQERSSDARGFAAADLALHRERGGDPSGASQSYVDAAQHAASLFAHDETIRHASKAIELTADDDVRARALLVREQALGRSGRRDEQALDIDSLSGLTARSDDDELAWETLRRRLRYERSVGDREKQDQTVTELERRSSAAGDKRRRAEALLARASYLVWLTSHAQAEAPATEALDLYERIGDSAGQVEALVILTEVATSAGDFDRSRRLLISLRKRAEGQADQTLVLRAIAAATAAELQRHDIDSASELAREGLALSRSIGDREEEASMLQRLATVATFQADFDGARRLFSEAADAMQAIGNLRGISHALANQFVLAMRLGLLAEAEQLGVRALDLVHRTGERRPLAVTKVNMSLNRLLQGDTAAAKRLALEALEIAQDIKFPLFVGAALSNLGNAERVTGDMAEGLKHLEEGLELRKPLLAPTDLLDDYCDLAVGYLQAGRLDDAIGAAKTLLDIAADSTAGAFWPHYCYWAGALVRCASGDLAESKTLLDRAVTVMESFAGNIVDPATRTAFTALPLNREIVAASQRDEWPAYAHGATARYTPVRRRKKVQ